MSPELEDIPPLLQLLPTILPYSIVESSLMTLVRAMMTTVTTSQAGKPRLLVAEGENDMREKRRRKRKVRPTSSSVYQIRFPDILRLGPEAPPPPGAGSSIWNRMAAVAGALTVNVTKAWESGGTLNDGEGMFITIFAIY